MEGVVTKVELQRVIVAQRQQEQMEVEEEEGNEEGISGGCRVPVCYLAADCKEEKQGMSLIRLTSGKVDIKEKERKCKQTNIMPGLITVRFSQIRAPPRAARLPGI